MKRKKIFVVLFMMLMMGFCAGSVYASDDNTTNVTEESVDKNGKTVEYLASNDGYLQITQIIQNSQNVKINTSTFDSKLLISGKVNKGTEVKISIYSGEATEPTVKGQAIEVGASATFSQALEIKEGKNRVIVRYSNKKDSVEDLIKFYVTKESDQTKEAIKSYLAIPSIG